MTHIYMIGGPNGAGKTTSALQLLPDLLKCEEYVNADAIAAALSPFHPNSTAIQAGRLMLERIHTLAQQKKAFAFETTMASRSFWAFLQKCKSNGYEMTAMYLWLENYELAIKRVKLRVRNGGHSVPEDVICRRYTRGLKNFFELYLPLADNWHLYDNSKEKAEKIAESIAKKVTYHNLAHWHKIQGGIKNE